MKWLLRFVPAIAVAAIYAVVLNRLAQHEQLPSFAVQLEAALARSDRVRSY